MSGDRFFAPEAEALRFLGRWLFLLKTPLVLVVVLLLIFVLQPPHVRDDAVAWLRDTGEVVSGFAPAAIFATAVVAGIVAYWTIRQKNDADRRAEWWRRMQWAIDAALSGNEPGGNEQKAAVGSDVLGELFYSGLRTAEDADLADAVSVALETSALVAESDDAGPRSDRSPGAPPERGGTMETGTS